MKPEDIAASLPFVEQDCAVGGVFCAAWSDWFFASVDADPACNDGEGRDPVPLTDFPFKLADCHDVARCRMRARAVRSHLMKEHNGDAN